MSAQQDRPLRYFSEQVWVVTNWGIMQEVFLSRRDALEHARRMAVEEGYTRETWQKLFEIRKMRLSAWIKGR